MAKFDNAGKFTGGPTNLIQLELPSGADEVYFDSICATVGPESVAVALTMDSYSYADDKSTTIGRFFETDFNGNLIGGIREVPFDANLNQIAYFFHPIWSGTRWLVPARVTEYGIQRRHTCQLFSADSMAATAPISATDFEIRVIYDTGSVDTFVFTSQFLPFYEVSTNQPSTLPSRFNLFIQTYDTLPEDLTALTKSNITVLIQQIDDRGAKVGKAVKAGVKPWSRAKTAEEGMIISIHSEFYSHFLALGDDSYLAARTTGMQRKSEVLTPPAKYYMHEGRLSLILLSNKFKKAEEIAGYTFTEGLIPDDPPILAPGYGNYWVIAPTWDPVRYKYYFFVATMPVQ